MDSMTDCNYLIAAYLGQDRPHPDPRYQADPSFFLRQHIQSLERLQHSLAQITVICSGDDPTGFVRTLDGARIGGAPVKTLMRPNLGMSYGAWSDAFELDRGQHSTYLLNEDDYVFTQDHFDETLTQILLPDENVGMVCGCVYKAPRQPEVWDDHAAVFIALCRANALSLARANAFSPTPRLPYHTPDASSVGGAFGQKAFSFAIIDAGFELRDWMPTWATAYWDSAPARVRWFMRPPSGIGDPRSFKSDLAVPSFVVPLQAMDRGEVHVSDGHGWHRGALSWSGHFIPTES
jgi:hypothetical protein